MEGNLQKIRIIVQGGAYRRMPNDKKEDYMSATRESARTGYRVLLDGGSAVDAVEAAVRFLEDNEDFNAGRGSLLNNEREVECDAMIMEGHTLNNGGVAGKHKGRVGDAPLVGCGGYANETGAATATGIGELIIKMTLTREVVYNMENGKDAQESAENAMKKMEERVNGNCGIIALDKRGNFGMAFNTNMMAWARIKDNTLESGMEKDELETEQM